MMRLHKHLALALVLIMVVSVVLTGCGKKQDIDELQKTEDGQVGVIGAMFPDEEQSDEEGVRLPVIDRVEATVQVPDYLADLDETQRNSIHMLNHLVVLAQEVNDAKNSRLYLEDAYVRLLNDTAPGAVDARTQAQINDLLDTMESYRMLTQKRERLQQIYDENKAFALRSFAPNSIDVRNIAGSENLITLVTTIALTAIDDVSSYDSELVQNDLQYLQDQWALEDEEAAVLHAIRKGTFNYMVDTVRDYDLPDQLALSEKAVETFVEWKNKTNKVQVIQFFEDNLEVYQAYGPYWLVLAECYYEVGRYEDCLSAIANYEQLQTGIYRYDHEYARVLTLAIASLEQLYEDEQCVQLKAEYVQKIIDNCDKEKADWVLRYYAAQTYIDLFGTTEDLMYLEKAYEIIRNNVTCLVDDQKTMNADYLAPLMVIEPAKEATDSKKKEIKQYNKLLKEERKTALPAVYEPLLLNCELLYVLMEELEVSQEDKARVEAILYGDGSDLFLIQPIDELFEDNADDEAMEALCDAVVFDGIRLMIPVQLVSETAQISVKVRGSYKEITDWTVKKVDREEESKIETFTAVYESEAIRDVEWEEGMRVTLEILPKADCTAESIALEYVAQEERSMGMFKKLTFRRK